MNDVKYEHFKAFDAIYDHEFAYWKTAHIRPQIVIPPATCSWIPSEQPETVGESLRLAVSDLYATAFTGYIKPYAINLFLGRWQKAKTHLTLARLSRKSGRATPVNLVC